MTYDEKFEEWFSKEYSWPSHRATKYKADLEEVWQTSKKIAIADQSKLIFDALDKYSKFDDKDHSLYWLLNKKEIEALKKLFKVD